MALALAMVLSFFPDAHPDDEDDDDDDDNSTAASDANDNADTVGVKLVDDAPMTTTAGSSRGTTTLRVICGTGPGFCCGCSSSCRLDAAALLVVSIYHWPAMMQ